MSLSPEISVLLPVHNGAKTVGLAIKSLLWSLPKSSEILVFLDGCTDDSEEIISFFDSNRIRVIKSETQVGVAQGLNRLLSEAKGKYIARMDADDICLPWRFWGYKTKLEKFDLLFSSQVNFAPKRGILVRQPFILPLNNSEITEVLKEANTLVHSSLISKKDTLVELGGYSAVPAEDYNLWIRALLGGKILAKTWFPRILFRVHEKQLTKTLSWQKRNAESTENDILLAKLASMESAQPRVRKLQSLYLTILKNREHRSEGKADRAYFLSLLDSAVWRSSTLVLSLAIAALCAIEDYALYAAGALATTFFQGLVEGSLRMLQVTFYKDRHSLVKIKKLSTIVLLVSMCLLSVLFLGISLLFTGSLDAWFLLAPFVLSLPLMRVSTISQILMQAAGNWKSLVSFRIISVLVMLVAMLPTLFQTRSILVGSFALALNEFIFVCLSRIKTKNILTGAETHPFNSLIAQKKYTEALETQVGLWLRSQLDRVLVVLLANPKLVGFYFLAFTIARTPSETLSSGATRRLKSVEFSANHKSSYIALRKNIFFIQATSFVSIVAFVALEPLILVLVPKHWNELTTVIPFFIVATVPAALSAALFEFNFRFTRDKKRWSLYIISLVGACLVATCLNIFGLAMAAIALGVKELSSSAYWFKTSRIPAGSFLGFQTAILTLASALVSLWTLTY